MKNYLSLIKFSHTLFAMPFALTAFFYAVASGYGFGWALLAKVVLCMVFARSAAMAFNRYLDRNIDARNDRTKGREIPAGKISPRAALVFTIVNCMLFMAGALAINLLCFYLSPVALLVILGYSYTKRFTWLCHLVLGVGLGIAPAGAYIAVAGRFALFPALLSLAVMLWTAGFDIIYALQDEKFDTDNRLHSIPARFRWHKAMCISRIMHAATFAALAAAAVCIHAGILFWTGVAVFSAMMIFQHIIAAKKDLALIGQSFGTVNGISSVVFAACAIAGFYL